MVNRIQGVDAFRLLAIVGVIAIHTSPFRSEGPAYSDLYRFLDIGINQVCRFAVPFFFVISGYFWGLKVRSGGDAVAPTLKMSKRIATIFVIWSLIYLLPLNIWGYLGYGVEWSLKAAYQNLVTLSRDPLTLVMQGSKSHLWFFMALLFAVVISAVFVHLKLPRTLIAVAVALYAFGLLAKAYAYTPLGIHIHFDTRNGPFFGTLLFVAGYFMSALKPDEKWFKYGLALFFGGCALHFLEVLTLSHYFGISLYQDYVAGTCLMGVGAAMLALSGHRILDNAILARLGQLTLGIYAIHMLFVEWLLPIDRMTHNAWWEVGYVFIVFGASTLVAFLLSRNRFTRRLVS